MSGFQTYTLADLQVLRVALFLYRAARKEAHRASGMDHEESDLLALSAKVSLSIGDHDVTPPADSRWSLIPEPRPEDTEK